MMSMMEIIFFVDAQFKSCLSEFRNSTDTFTYFSFSQFLLFRTF